MDGVMIDSEYIYTKSITQVMNELGYSIDRDYIYQFTGTTHHYTWQSIKNKYKLDREEDFYIEQMFEKVEELKKSQGLRPYPGIVELIKKLYKTGLKLAIASSSNLKDIEETVDFLEVRAYFEHLVSGQFIKNSKPSPDIYTKTAKLLNVKAVECIVIEDSSNGVKAAKDAEMYCIGFVDDKYPPQDLSRADIIINHFDYIDIEELLIS